MSSIGTELVQSRITFIHSCNALVSMFPSLMKRLNTVINYVILFEMILHLCQNEYIYSELDGTIPT